MLSALYILSSRGDTIMKEKYRNDVSEKQLKSAVSMIFKSKSGLNPPCFKCDDIHGYSIKKDKIFYLAISKREIPNIMVLHFLESFDALVRNFCGGTTEDYITKNLVLVHELMTECVDNGFIKSTNTEQIRPTVYSDPSVVKQSQAVEVRKPGPFGMEKVSSAADRPFVKSRSQQNINQAEIFLDVMEGLTVHFTKEGLIQRFRLDGIVKIKSFISLNHQVLVSLDDKFSCEGSDRGILFDQCHFDECVDARTFDKHRSFTLTPSQGEIQAMLYSLENPALVPFRLTAAMHESDSNRDCDLILKLTCNFPTLVQAQNLSLHIPVSSCTRNVMQQFSMYENAAEYLSKERKILWKIKKMHGQGEIIAKFKLVDAMQIPANRLEMGPVSLEFEASNITCSGITVKDIKAKDLSGAHIPILKWVRYAVCAKSYVFNIR